MSRLYWLRDVEFMLSIPTTTYFHFFKNPGYL